MNALQVPVVVAGTGLHLPERVVTNDDLAQMIDTSDEWIVSRTGIRERRWLAPELAVSDMCVAAARPALDEAGLLASELDVIIVATYTWDQPLPSTALIVKEAIGAHKALTLDVTHAACANGLQAAMLAAHLLQTSTARSVLVIAADCASRVTDPEERTTRIFFGDAAGAAVLRRGDVEGSGLLSWDFGSELSHDVEIRAGGSRRPTSAATIEAREHYVSMNGRTVWETATRWLPDSILKAVDKARMSVGDIDHFFLHQANLNIIKAAVEKLGVSMDRAPVTLDRLGNTGSAGVFTALHQSYSQGLVRQGDTFVMSAIGAGFQWGTLCFRHA
ncbi:3-oxoacyl-ACP synthase III [Lentzea sp. NBRC 105346]|uniref:3-oxoacyl-ACP synthase III family protein n=1 Tax=Lentzea sp. NBRC 105346 TaxID=3032205 RepID=UPI0024A589B6|nr:beta-ketoacyl-ACP synthase 3 [Lentzea sp. NBRC 105346]GLZ32479.1 3-oxoacyl-ACP synthase III [Lentzea sp. NBRC 105346]